MRKLLLLLLTVALPSPGVIVDRVAISAGNQVITASEVDLRLRLTAFQNGEKPEGSKAARKKAAEQLIDQKLVEREMEVGHYPRLSAEGRKLPLKNFANQFYQADLTALERALAAYKLTMRDLEEELARQSDLLSFLGVRFRPVVQVSEEDMQKRAQDKQISLDQFRNQIEQNLAAERADADLEVWLKDQRKRTKIEYLDQELAP